MHCVAVLLLFALALAAQAPPTAAAVTEPGRTLARPLDIVLGSAAADGGERALVVVLDPSPGLASAGFADAFAAAVAANERVLATTRLGLCVVGDKEPNAVPLTREHRAVVAGIAARLQRPATEFQNVYAAVRAAAQELGGSKGERLLLLVTLENGDVEDDVELTVGALQKGKVRAFVLTSEATLADSYWAARPYQDKPRGTVLTGADGPAVDLPWGWLFQVASANETTPAGHAMWGLSRLAAGTDGRVFLHASATQVAHQCAIYSACLFCSGDHAPPDDHWNTALVAMLAPFVGPRSESLSALGRDPAFRAMVETWRAAAREGLLRSQPAIKVTGTSASPDRARDGRGLGLTDTANWDRNEKRAEQAAQRAKALGDALAKELDGIAAEATTPRALAAARYTVVLLQLTRVNLLGFAAWCRDVAPALFDEKAPDPLLPELPAIDDDRRPVGIGYSNFSLCHGVQPFFEVELPGGAALRPELERLDALFVAYQRDYGKSQFGYALRRNGIARFWPTFPGIAGELPRRRPKSANEPTTPITPQRPARGGGSSGAPTGPVTGGGR
jgi:hypothetical protein